MNISVLSEVQDFLLDPQIRENTPIPQETLESSLELLCVRCWQSFAGFGRPACPECGATRPSAGWSTMPYTFRDRYVFWKVLGRGGMGAVFLAHDQHQSDAEKKAVAIKVVPETGSPALREALKRMFEREASAASMLAQSPHFVRVTSHDIGVEPAYLAMEYVDWPTLRGLLRRGQGKVRPLSPVKVARIGIALLRGLATMHFHRIVHRDLKPDNIFVRRAGDGDDYEIKILDLGVWAYDTGDESSTHSLPGIEKREASPVGTYSYMSPEQMSLEGVTAASDLHTVGSVLWELATGRVPYPMAKRELEAAVWERREALRRVPERPTAMPEGLYAALARALAFDPQDRFSSADEMKLALKTWVGEELRRSESMVSEAKGRFELLAAQVEALRGRLAPAKDLVRDLDTFADRLKILERHAEEAAPDVLAQSTADADDRFRRLSAELDEFALGVKKTVAAGEIATGDLPLVRSSAPPARALVTPTLARAPQAWHVAMGVVLLMTSVLLLLRPPRPGKEQSKPAAAHVTPAPARSLAETLSASMATGHSAGFVGVAFQPLSGALASPSADGTVRWYRGDELRPDGMVVEPSGPILEACYAPDGRLYATLGEDSQIRVYHVETRRLLFTARVGEAVIRALAFSADARLLLAGGEDGQVRPIEVATGRALAPLPSPRPADERPSRHHRRAPPPPAPAPIRAIACSADGQRVAAAHADGTVSRWAEGRALPDLMLQPGGAQALAYSPDGSLLAAGGADPKIHLLRTDREEVETLEGSARGVRSLAFSPDGERLVSGGLDYAVRIFDLPRRRLLRTLEGHEAPIYQVAVSADGSRIASGGQDRRVLLWNLATGDRLAERRGASPAIRSLALSPDGSWWAVAAQDLRLIDAQTGATRAVIPGDHGPVEVARISPDGTTIAAAGRDRVLRLYTARGELLREQPVDVWLRDLAFTSAGVVGGGSDGKVYRFELPTLEPRGEAEIHRGPVRAILAAAGKIYSAGEDGLLRTLDEQSLGPLNTLDLGAPLRALAISSDGHRLAVGGLGQAVAIVSDQGALLRVHSDLGAPILSLAFSESPDQVVAGSGDGFVHWLSVNDERRYADVALHALGTSALVRRPDGVIISGGVDGALLWIPSSRLATRAIAGPASSGWTELAYQTVPGAAITTK
ncbi:MAG: protein kinase [Myxococcota bacterium]